MGVSLSATVRHPTSRTMWTAHAIRMTARENEKKSGPAKKVMAAVVMVPTVTARKAARPTVHALWVRSGE
jgi:hypothetical protein